MNLVLERSINLCRIFLLGQPISLSKDNYRLSYLEKIKLNDGRILTFVDSWPHLGFLLHKDQSPDHDLMTKRGQFIGKLYSMRQQFGNIDPIV